MSGNRDFRTYQRADCAVFRKTAEAFGGLSNMAPGFPVRVNGVRILTVEALYQACRFPHRPEVQRKIIEQTSPMTAKMVGKPFRADSRPDWDRVRVKIMRWVLRLKLAMHWTKFSELLLSTGDRPIVEDSRKDDFWGAMLTSGTTLIGMNVLGRLLMELREEIKQGKELRRVEPPSIPEFLLFDEAIGVVDFRHDKSMPYSLAVEHAQSAVHDFSLPLFGNDLVMPPSESQTVVVPQAIAVQGNNLISMLKPYVEYKESGQKWLGGIPARWELKPGHAAFSKRKESNLGMKEKTVLSLSYGRIKVKAINKQHGLVPESYETYQVVNEGNIIIRGTDLQNDHTSLRIGLSRNRGIISSAYLCLEAQPTITPDYGYQILNVFDLTKAIYRYGSGLRQNLDHGEIKRLPIFLPPLDEQAAIVRFLDYANRKIDGFVRTKRKLIALLNEQKQAIIHRAVTRGLQPDIPLKPSGIPWLGEIPEHWSISRVKNEFKCLNPRRIPLSSTQRGAMTQRLYDYYGASGVIDKVEDFIFDDQLLLVAEDGANLVLRNLPLAIIAKGKFWVNNHAHILKPKRGNLEYLAGFMETLNYQPWISGAAQPKLTKDRIMGIAIAVAPTPEQAEIAEYFTEKTAPLRTAIARTEREIALMQEYRTRLTADIVTGKLDVREAAATLPDLPTDPVAEPLTDEPPDETETEDAEA
jgi:type I restriction enzyme S subunit